METLFGIVAGVVLFALYDTAPVQKAWLWFLWQLSPRIILFLRAGWAEKIGEIEGDIMGGYLLMGLTPISSKEGKEFSNTFRELKVYRERKLEHLRWKLEVTR